MPKHLNKVRILVVLIMLIVISSLVFFWYKQAPGTKNIVSSEQLISNLLTLWSTGDVVVLVRHAERCDRSDNPCLQEAINKDKKEREGITIQGKEMALQLGKHFQSLLHQKSPTVIYNSPVTRTSQTAQLMFNSQTIEKKWLRQGCKKHLLKNIFANKKENQNMILVTHATCIDRLGETEGSRLINMDILNKDTYGISIFMAINKTKQEANVLGYIKAEDWQKLLKSKLFIK